MKALLIAVLSALLLSACKMTPVQVVDRVVGNYCVMDEVSRQIWMRDSFNKQLKNGQIMILCPSDMGSDK